MCFLKLVGGGRKSSETEETPRRTGSEASSVSDEGGFNEPSPEVVARLRPADYRSPPALTLEHRDHERARSDPDTLSVLQQVCVYLYVQSVLVIEVPNSNLLRYRKIVYRSMYLIHY